MTPICKCGRPFELLKLSAGGELYWCFKCMGAPLCPKKHRLAALHKSKGTLWKCIQCEGVVVPGKAKPLGSIIPEEKPPEISKFKDMFRRCKT